MKRILLSLSLMLATFNPAIADDSAYDNSQCNGLLMGKDQALSYFTPGSKESSPVTPFIYIARVRKCNSLTGCVPWKDYDYKNITTYSKRPYKGSGIVKLMVRKFDNKEPQIDINMTIENQTNTTLGIIGEPLNMALSTHLISRIGVPDFFDNNNHLHPRITTLKTYTITDKCFQIIVNSKLKPDNNANYSEYEFATLSFF